MILDEEKLLKEIKNDPQKFGELFDMFYGKIFGYVFRRTADYDSAKDITAEVFLKAFTGIQKFKWRNISIIHWLYRIATNELNKYFKKRNYLPQSLNRIQEEYGFDITDYSNAESERIALEEDIINCQQYVQINNMINELDIKYQSVLTLRYFEKKSIKEIAEILNKNDGTVKSLLSRGINKLRDKLSENSL